MNEELPASGGEPQRPTDAAGASAVVEALERELEAPLRRFRPYPQYKDSGVEWMGQVPAHWDTTRLKHVAQTSAERASLAMDILPYVALEHIEPGTGRLIRDVTSELSPESTVSHFRSGDVLFGKLRPYLAKVVRVGFDGICSTELVVLRAGADLLSSFLAYALRSSLFINWLDALTYGAKMPRVSPDQLTSQRLAVPPLGEQYAVIEVLDRETAKIDALVAKKEQLIHALEEERAALITQAVTKGVNPSAPSKKSDIMWLGDIPAHWKVKRLWHLTPADRRIMYGIVLPGLNVADGVPIVKGGDVSTERLKLDLLNRTTFEIESHYVRSRLRGGDLVYAIRGSIGEAAIVPDELFGANITQDAARVAYTVETDGKWLLFALKSQAAFAQLEAGSLGATIKGINIRDLKRVLLPVPPKDEQEEIAAFLDAGTRRLDGLVRKIRGAINCLKEYRTALISAAVTGKIDVREEVA